MHKYITHSSLIILEIYCIFYVFSLIYIYENNAYGVQSVNCYFSYNSNKLRQDVALRERASEFKHSFIVLAFFNGVNMSHDANELQKENRKLKAVLVELIKKDLPYKLDPETAKQVAALASDECFTVNSFSGLTVVRGLN